MRRYHVHEYMTKGLFAYRPLNRMIRSKFAKPNRRGGIIVFPDGVKETDIDTTFINGRFRIDYLLPEDYTERDGTLFSKYSPCVDIRDYKSGDMMTVALRYARSFPGGTFLLKDIDDRRLFSICYTLDETAARSPVVNLNEIHGVRAELKAA